MNGYIISGEFTYNNEKIMGTLHAFTENDRQYTIALFSFGRIKPLLSGSKFIYNKYKSFTDGNRIINIENVLSSHELRNINITNNIQTIRQKEAEIKDNLESKLPKFIQQNFHETNIICIGREYHLNEGVIDFLYRGNNALYPIEVKSESITVRDLQQLKGYCNEIKDLYPNMNVYPILIGKENPIRQQSGTFEYNFYSIENIN